jgi:hypothetical protein
MSTTAKVPPAKAARIVEWVRHHLYRLNQRLAPAPAAMMEMIIATWTSQAITVAAELGVADALADGQGGRRRGRTGSAVAGVDRAGRLPSSARRPV